MRHASPTRSNAHERREISGEYANYFRVGFNACEFVCEFGQFYPEEEASRFHTRIITTPTYMKNLIELLQESYHAYEKEYEQSSTLVTPTTISSTSAD